MRIVRNILPPHGLAQSFIGRRLEMGVDEFGFLGRGRPPGGPIEHVTGHIGNRFETGDADRAVFVGDFFDLQNAVEVQSEFSTNTFGQFR